ncbi:AMP-binding protein [Kitasatospora cineracea]
MPEKTGTVVDLLLERGAAEPDRTAVVLSDGRRISYGELVQRVFETAEQLPGKGLGMSSRIGLWFLEGEWIDYAVGYFAALLNGSVAVVLPTDSDRRGIRRICRDLGIDHVLSAAARPFGSAEVRDVPVAGPATGAGRGGRPVAPLDPARLADVVFTSGSTGTPKGVAASHEALAGIADGYRARSGGAAVVAHGVSHATAVGTRQLLLSAVARGSTLVACVPFEARSFLAAAAAESAATAVLPAAAARSVARALEDDPALRPAGLRTLRFMSDHLPAELHLALAALLPGTRVVNTYGLTEAGDAHLVTTQQDCGLGPGGFPAPGTEVGIMSASGDWLERGEEGYLCIRDRLPALGYLTDPMAAARTWRDGWTVTGDLALIDGTGRVRIKGRSRGLARVGGRTVSVSEVKAALETLPGVEAAAVVVLPHPTLGQSLAAVVEGPADAPAEDVKAALAGVLPAHAVPSPVVRVEQLPRSRTGKPHQDAITALVRRRMSASSRPCRTATEVLVGSVWSGVLELDGAPGADADFFQLGGDSMAAVEVLAELEGRLGVDIPLDLLFTRSSVGELARELDRLRAER